NPFSGITLASDADAGARAVFVAEFAEVLMAYRNRHTGTTNWNAGDSAGESLAAVCAATLYPDAWYNAALGLGPRIPRWMQANPRPYNWITQSEPTDTNFVSFGCSILFINYLSTQRGYSLTDVI